MKANSRRSDSNAKPPRQPKSAQKKQATARSARSTPPQKNATRAGTPKNTQKTAQPKQQRPKSKFFPPSPPQKLPKPPLTQRLRQACINSLSHLLPLVGLLTIGLLITGTGILSARFLVAPKSIAWVNDYLPEALQVPVPEWDRPQTLEDIKKSLTTGDRTVGEVIELANKDRLIPIIQNGYNCSSKCDRIAELRVYHPAKGNGPKRTQPHFRLVAQLEVANVPDWTIADSLSQSENGSSNTSGEALPLETYESLDAPDSSTGNWFNLTGKRQQGEFSVAYGQIFHYDPKTYQLTALIPWSSPSPDRPLQWTQLTGSSTPELLIDHSIGLEPHFQAYQVSLQGTPALTPISLKQAASKDSEAPSAIKLAKVGLWSLAADRLKRIKSNGGNWGTTAQSQFDLITHHAKLTQAQAQQTWASVDQQVLVKLMDGRWQEALTVIEKDPLLQAEVRDSFKTETARLWKRLSVAIEDDPGNPILQAWTAMIMNERDGTAKTQKWLTQQGGSRARTRALEMLAPSLLPPKPKPEEKSILKPIEKLPEKPTDSATDQPIDKPTEPSTENPTENPIPASSNSPTLKPKPSIPISQPFGF